MLTEDADGNAPIKLIDLGIARMVGGPDSHLTKTRTFLGKLRHASAEHWPRLRQTTRSWVSVVS
jgi:hypothetical protein